eukprot:6198714-Pleurochrysis_carterae.AAC.1
MQHGAMPLTYARRPVCSERGRAWCAALPRIRSRQGSLRARCSVLRFLNASWEYTCGRGRPSWLDVLFT